MQPVGPTLFEAFRKSVIAESLAANQHFDRGGHVDGSYSNEKYRTTKLAAIGGCKKILSAHGFDLEGVESPPVVIEKKFDVHKDKSQLIMKMQCECNDTDQVLSFYRSHRRNFATNEYAWTFGTLLRMCNSPDDAEKMHNLTKVRSTKDFKRLVKEVNSWGTKEQSWRYKVWRRKEMPVLLRGFRLEDVLGDSKVNFYHRPWAAARIFQGLSEFGHHNISPGR